MTIKEFYDQVASNEDVKKKVAELTKSGKSLDDIIKEFNLEGTVDDIKAYAGKLVEEGKLDKSQLDEVAGGTTPVTTVTTVGAAAGTVSLAACELGSTGSREISSRGPCSSSQDRVWMNYLVSLTRL